MLEVKKLVHQLLQIIFHSISRMLQIHQPFTLTNTLTTNSINNKTTLDSLLIVQVDYNPKILPSLLIMSKLDHQLKLPQH